MAAVGPRWRVTITLGPGSGWIRHGVVAQNEGAAAHVALGGLVTRTEALREFGPLLGAFEVRVEPEGDQ